MKPETTLYTRPRISVVMSVYNGREHVKHAVNSILRQSFSNFELIIIDDGSTDGTTEIVRSYANNDARIRLQIQHNQGLTNSLNTGIRLAQAEFIARMDADDRAHPNRFARQLAQFEANPRIVCCGTWAIETDDQGRPYGYWRTPVSHSSIDELHINGKGGGIIHPTAMMRREVVLDIGGYDSTYSFAQDYDLWLRLAEVGELANVPEFLLYYRRAGNSITNSKRLEQLELAQKIYRAAANRRQLKNFRLLDPVPQEQDIPAIDFLNISLKNGFYGTYLHYALLHVRTNNNKLRAFLRVLKQTSIHTLRRIRRSLERFNLRNRNS